MSAEAQTSIITNGHNRRAFIDGEVYQSWYGYRDALAVDVFLDRGNAESPKRLATYCRETGIAAQVVQIKSHGHVMRPVDSFAQFAEGASAKGAPLEGRLAIHLPVSDIAASDAERAALGAMYAIFHPENRTK